MVYLDSVAPFDKRVFACKPPVVLQAYNVSGYQDHQLIDRSQVRRPLFLNVSSSAPQAIALIKSNNQLTKLQLYSLYSDRESPRHRFCRRCSRCTAFKNWRCRVTECCAVHTGIYLYRYLYLYRLWTVVQESALVCTVIVCERTLYRGTYRLAAQAPVPDSERHAK